MVNRPDRLKAAFKLDAELDLSLTELTEEETKVLARGFKFKSTLTQLPMKDII